MIRFKKHYKKYNGSYIINMKPHSEILLLNKRFSSNYLKKNNQRTVAKMFTKR